MQGPIQLKTFKNIVVGRTSSGLEEGFICPNRAAISSMDTGQKEEPLVSGLDMGEMFALILATLSIKYLRKLLQSLFDEIGSVGMLRETI